MKNKNKKKPGFFSPEAQEERARLRHKYALVMQSWSFTKSSRLNGYIFKFDYEIDKYKSSFEFPILTPLPEIEFNPIVDDTSQKNISDYLSELLSKTVVLAGVLFAAVAGMCKAILDLNKLRLGLTSYSVAATYSKVVMLGSSLAVVSGVIIAYAVLPILRARLKARFDYIEYDLRCKFPWRPEHGSEKYFIKLPLIYSIILSRYFPGNRDLKWRFYYLEACCRHKWHYAGCSVPNSYYNSALDYCDNVDQQFLCLRGKINAAFKLHSSRQIEKEYDDHVQYCVSQISSKSRLHKELGELLRTKLVDCLNTLVSDNHLGAIQKFNAIDFDAYSKKAYPGLTILYYQLDAVLTVMGRDNPSLEVKEPCDGTRLCAINNSFCIVRENVDKYYKHLSSLMYAFAYNYEEFKRDLPRENKPKPGLPLITRKFDNHFKVLSIESSEDTDLDATIRVNTTIRPDL